jgi:CheY-specific phosphatase CheX
MSALLSEVVNQLAAAALVDVFSSYGTTIAPLRVGKVGPSAPHAVSIDDSRDDGVVAGVVGFSGPVMRGTLMLASAFEVIGAARPPELRRKPLSRDVAYDWIMVRDWCGELANQVLGRIKNGLHRYKVTFDVARPTALSGPALAFAAPQGPSPQQLVFMTGKQKVWFCMDCIIRDDQRVSDAAAEMAAPEGSVILFK